jgi:hypothetical protein
MSSAHTCSLIALATLALLAACESSSSSGGGGSAGTASSGDGGSGATGGSAAGGGGSGGEATGGSGGGGGSGSPRCEPLCQTLAGSGCDSAPVEENCLVTCLMLTSSSACEATADDYFDCTEAATVDCNAAGEAYFPGCGDEWLVAIDCAVNENPNPAIEQPCDDYCDKIVAANCPQNGTKDECYTNCLWFGAGGTGCDDELSTYLSCANDSMTEMICIAGYAVAVGCGPAWTAYTDCMNAVGG